MPKNNKPLQPIQPLQPDLVRVRMLASRRSKNNRHQRGDALSLPRDLAEQYVNEGAARRVDAPSPEQATKRKSVGPANETGLPVMLG